VKEEKEAPSKQIMNDDAYHNYWLSKTLSNFHLSFKSAPKPNIKANYRSL
jgi:hypothetical protein